MRWPYHVINILNLLIPSMLVIKLISNLQIPINALAFGSVSIGIFGLLINLVTLRWALTIT